MNSLHAQTRPIDAAICGFDKISSHVATSCVRASAMRAAACSRSCGGFIDAQFHIVMQGTKREVPQGGDKTGEELNFSS
jgi:hypothetical protein